MQLNLIKKQKEAKDTYSFYFSSSEKLTWIPGQYAYITLGNITKQFTIASSPTEEFIQITTRIRRESEFKQALNALEIGSLVESRLPFGSLVFNFTLNPVPYSEAESHTLFLAGGIGITPFRSFIKYNIDKKLGIPMHLIYSNSNSEFVFKEELGKWQKENDFIKIYYHNSDEFGHINSLKIESLIKNFKLKIKNCIFWSVGSKMFVNSMEDILEELNIPTDKINTEKFTGY